mmetsp:Transcript_39733/g.40344  ORF Transcript_39733/g.40344 Transcript_39733/m.40344 type:complete len:104 (-) Transcript_39733:205-516(-)
MMIFERKASSRYNNDDVGGRLLSSLLMNRLLTQILKLVKSTKCNFKAHACRTSQRLARHNLNQPTHYRNRKRNLTSRSNIKIITSEDDNTHNNTYSGQTKKSI